MSSLREKMPIATRFAYLDHAAVSPLPQPTRETIQAWLDEASQLGVTAWSQWESRVDPIRSVAAALLGAQTSEIAFVANTTTGIGFVAEGFPWRAGDNVVVAANEFPSNLLPWLNLESRGVEVRRVASRDVRVEIDDLIAACDTKTRLITVSWVGFATGWRLDLDELAERAHARGVLLFVDAIQGLGVFPLDLTQTPLDFLAADGHKWLLGSEGAGLLFVREPHFDLLRPLGTGWNSVTNPYEFTPANSVLRHTAARYEGGTRNMVGTLALGSSLRVLSDAGLSAKSSALANCVLELGDYACSRLGELGARIVSDRSAKHASGIVAFELPGRDCREIRKRCLEQDVVLSCRGGWVRISPHAYNIRDDIDRLVEAIKGKG